MAYFAKVHPFWPILHGPTFSINYASDLLLASMALMVSWLGGTADHRHSFVEVFEAASSPAVSN